MKRGWDTFFSDTLDAPKPGPRDPPRAPGETFPALIAAVDAFLPATAYVPLTGLLPCVEAGAVVQEGQVIAQRWNRALKKADPYGAAIHAPMPGKVEGFVRCTLPWGVEGMAAKIKSGGEFSYLGKAKKTHPWQKDSADTLCRTLAERGVQNLFTRPASLGGQIQGMPSAQKRLVVATLFDQDASSLADSFIARRYPGEILEGLAIIAQAAQADGVALVFPQKGPPPDLGSLTAKLKETPVNADAVPVSVGMGERNHLGPTKEEIIAALRAAHPDTPFAALGHRDLFVDSTTLFHAYRAVALGLPVMESLVHLTGTPIRRRGMFFIRQGMLIRDMVEECGGFIDPPAAIVVNGVLGGTSITRINTPVTKEVKSIRFLHRRELPDQRVHQCLHCGGCRSVCPVHLEPSVLFSYMCGGNAVGRNYLASAMLCEECALCSAACPARLPLAQYIHRLKETFVENTR